MAVFLWLFWVTFFIIFYNYVGYGILLAAIVSLKKSFSRKAVDEEPFYLPVTFLIAAYNEEDFIEQKIKNTLAQNYPADKLEILIITDGSSDRTPEICRQFSEVKVMHEDARRGKTAALNRAMKEVTNPVVIFNDANTILNEDAVKNLVKHYKDPKVGGASGEKKVLKLDSKDDNVGEGEGLYWKYESFLKKLDSELYTVVGSAGELFSIRTELYEFVEENVILDDFIISLRINKKGYRIVYEPEAVAMENPSFSMEDEHKRKVRICAGGIQSIIMLKSLLNIFKYPVLSFEYISHRVLRWTLTPLSLPLIFIANVLLLNVHPYFYKVFFMLQLAFYVAALLGWYLTKRNIKFKPFYLPYYFFFMNLAVFQGFFKFIRGRQSAVWDKAKRG